MALEGKIRMKRRIVAGIVVEVRVRSETLLEQYFCKIVCSRVEMMAIPRSWSYQSLHRLTVGVSCQPRQRMIVPELMSLGTVIVEVMMMIGSFHGVICYKKKVFYHQSQCSISKIFSGK